MYDYYYWEREGQDRRLPTDSNNIQYVKNICQKLFRKETLKVVQKIQSGLWHGKPLQALVTLGTGSRGKQPVPVICQLASVTNIRPTNQVNWLCNEYQCLWKTLHRRRRRRLSRAQPPDLQTLGAPWEPYDRLPYQESACQDRSSRASVGTPLPYLRGVRPAHMNVLFHLVYDCVYFQARATHDARCTGFSKSGKITGDGIVKGCSLKPHSS